QIRVVVVDDTDDVRLLLQLLLRDDERFVVVGEAADGLDAIRVVAETQPDLVVLDRNMPRMGGVEALPKIRASAPQTSVILYTAVPDSHAQQAALAAGALHVLEKSVVGPEFIDRLASVLVDHWASPDADFEVRVGPVASASALVWINNAALILGAVRAHPDVLDYPIGEDVFDSFEQFLTSWRDIAGTNESFVWTARSTTDEVKRLVESWGAIDSVPGAQLAGVGCGLCAPEGHAFFEALSSGVLTSLEKNEATMRLAVTLSKKWVA